MGKSLTEHNGLIEIKLGPCRTGPTKRMIEDLEWAGQECNRVRNCLVRAWLRWREDHPEWTPAVMDGRPVSLMHPVWVTQDGTPVEPPNTIPADERKDWVKSHGGVTFSTWLYHRGRAIAPDLSTQLISYLAHEVLAHLKAVRPPQQRGTSRYRWEAILSCEDQVHTWNRHLVIPVPNCDSALCWRGEHSKAFPRQVADLREQLLQAGCWGPSLAFPLFSASAGRQWRSHVARLQIVAMTTGTHEQLRWITNGEWSFRDSKLTLKDGVWFFHLCYRKKSEKLELDASRVAHLWPNPPLAGKPFCLETGEPGTTDYRRWEVGRGDWLDYEFQRLDSKRRAIRNRYNVQDSGVRGHGRRRFEQRMAPWARKTHNCQDQFCWSLCAEAIKFLCRFNVGTVVWHEPDATARLHGWFTRRGVPFDWTSITSKLVYKLESRGVVVEVIREPLSLLRQQFEREASSYGARWPQIDPVLVVREADGTYSRFTKVQRDEVLDLEDRTHGSPRVCDSCGART